MTMTSSRAFPLRACVGVLLATLLGAACSNMKGKEEEEAAKNTIACQLTGERLLIRFDIGEARLLMPGGDRVALYQIPAASGIRYANGDLELRGKGMELQLFRNGTALALADCQQLVVPK
jgi:membrane-bound inhibitor of C-type lysozyme